jgi:PTH1 family peptidyl-tRNA hydrolase
MKLIVGLGNPGANYEQTRHNVGFRAIDQLAGNGSEFKQQFKALVSKRIIGRENVVLVKPQTFMNLSGQSVAAALSFYKLEVNDLIVLCDDVNLETGKIRVRTKGSHGGQNGLKDIIRYTGPDFTRVRLGVGLLPQSWDMSSFVLSKLAGSDAEKVSEMLEYIPELMTCLLNEGPQQCMSLYNS